MKIRTGVILLTIAALSVGGLAASRELPGRSEDAGFSLTRSGDLFSLHARDARLSDVLARLRELTELQLDVDPGLEARVTSNLDNVPVERILAALTQSRALVYERGPDKAERLIQARLTGQQDAISPDAPALERLGPAVLGRGVLTNSKRPIGELRRRNSPAILLENAVIDTEAARRGEKLHVPVQLAAPWDAEHQIVQFDKPVSDAVRKQLADLGIEVTHYVPNAAYAVRVTPEQLAVLQNLPGVVHVEPYHPYFKMSRDLLASLTGEEDATARARVEAGVFNALSFRGVSAREAIAAAGGEVVETQSVDGRERVTFRLPGDRLPEVLALSSVQWVEPDVPRKPLNDLAGKRVRAKSIRQAIPWLTGEGVTIGLTDSGIDFRHAAFALDPSLPTSTGLNTRIVAYHLREGGVTADGLPGDNVGHGTHVAGTILGNGALSDSVIKAPGSGDAPYATNQFAGIAPASKIVVIEDFSSFNDAEQAQLTLNAGARISNNSWGNSLYQYGTLSAIWDALLRDADTNAAGRQELIAFFAAGNDGAGNDDGSGGTAGTVGAPGNAKNVITIGALEQRRKADNLAGASAETDSDWQIASYSSRGPVTATDIRFKPDLVAPGSYVLSVQSSETLPDELIEPLLPHRDYRYGNLNSGTNYAFFSGTSMATPVAAGAGALFYQQYTNTFGVPPSPALMKAALVAGARMVNSLIYKMPYDSSLVNKVDQGFGLIDIKRSVSGPQLRPTDQIIFLDQTATDAVGTDEVYSYQIQLQAGQGGLKIVLAWSDPPGTPGNAAQLVNNLDLIVRAPGGGGYLGNQFDLDGVNSRKFANPNPDFGDDYNNVESVVISDAPIGTYTIQVRGYQVATAEKQSFALVVMKGIGIEGRSSGESVAMAMDTNAKPVIAYTAYDVGGQKQIYVKRWVGPYGDFSELGNWYRLDEQWEGYRHSAIKTGISRTLEDSEDPSIAVNGENVFVAWRERPRDIGGTNVSRIFVRQWDGSDWIQLNGSAQDFGVPNSVSLNTFSPQIGVMSNGRPVVAWLQYAGTSTNLIHVRVSAWDGSDWVGLAGSHTNGLAMSSTNTANVASSLSLAINRLGRPVVAWKESAINNSISVREWNGSAWTSLNYSNALFFISDLKVAAARLSDDLFLTWRQQISAPLPYTAHQIFAARRTGGSWTQMAGSFTHPGISATTNGANAIYPHEPSISIGEIDGTTNVIVSWRAGNTNGNYILVRQWRPGQTNWSSLFDAGDAPGVDIWPEKAAAPVSVADRFGLPIISFPLVDLTNASSIATYTVIADREPPLFAGLQTAVGGTNGNVTLGWLPAVDDTSTNIIYRIYRGTQTFACGTTPICNAGNVFSNLIATVTNLTTFSATGLTANLSYCFGVRAGDTNGLFEANTVVRSAAPVSGVGDNDADCLANGLELAAGTEPCVKDTDGDGMWDGWEWTFSTNNPAKTNSISISNTNVVFLNPVDNGIDNVRTLTSGDGDPANLAGADPDSDGASNYEEFDWWFTIGGASCSITNVSVPAGPNPTAWDTDLDGMRDGWEMLNGLNPISAADAATDLDGDGLNNLQEYQFGTDPRNTDSDGDGLSDGSEVNVHGSDPSLADSDGDGLDDGYEVNVSLSSPRIADSNGNFLSDGDSVQLGISPLGVVQAYNNLLFESFESTSGTRAAWTSYAISAPAMFNMWHLSTVEPTPSTGGLSIVYMHQRTTSTAYRAAFDPTGTDSNATYNMGVAVAMALQSPTLTNQAVAVSNLYVGWAEYYETEPNSDQTVVQARALPNTNWINIGATMSGMSGVTNVNLSNQTARWTYRIADASAFAGKSNVQIRFLFTVQNDINNSYRGWWVDDVRLYEGTVIQGWVRDINGRAVQGATVRALGRGGITNRVNGHAYVLPGRIFGEVETAVDGSYRINGLPQGNFYIKASAGGYRDEFYDGLLFTNGYAFGHGFRAGVFERESVSAAGIAALLSAGATTNVYFELEAGQGTPRLGVALPNGAGSTYPVWVNNLQPLVWNGSTSAPSLSAYLTSTNPLLKPNFPDWLTNNVAPTYVTDLAPGQYGVYAATNLPLYPLLSVDLRAGESTLLAIATNQAAARLFVTAATGGPYRVVVNGRVLTNLTPANVNVLAGPHEITLASTGALERFTTKYVTVPIGGRVDVAFSALETLHEFGALKITAKDPFGNAITNFSVYVNGSIITSNEVAGANLNAIPLTLNRLRPGSHQVALVKTGYRATAARPVTVFSGITNETEFVLYETDADYDRVGDALEIESYINRFLYHRDNDADADQLSNLREFDLFRLFGVRLNIFNGDTDGDGLSDGAELGYDGLTNRYAYSALYTNALQFAPSVQALFVGRYLDGIDNFGDGTGRVVSIEGDRFVGDILRPPVLVPTKEPALTVFTNIVTFPSNRAVSVGHNALAPVFADSLPHRVDSDGDSVWDGFEYLYRTNAALDLLDNSDPQRDPDSDDLVNALEFLGLDGIANTNDWINPGKADTDNDFMPDGWEYQYGLNPRSAADAFTDFDGEGLINLAEYLAGSSPRLQDTDADYLSDHREVIVYMTEPLDSDTDGDGLLDGREVWDKDMDGIQDGGFFPMWAGGDLDGDDLVDGPTDWDTDGDGIPDGFEVVDADGNIRMPGATLNPYDPTDGDEDADGDGLSNLQEYLVRDALFGNHPTAFSAFNAVWYGTLALWYGGADNGWNFDHVPFAYAPPIWDYATDPFDADTDGDGMPDGYEVLTGLHPMDPIRVEGSTITRFYLLGPKGDPDFDGLWNDREYRLRFAVDGAAGTNDPLGASTRPWNADTDGDGIDDGIEHHTMLLANPTIQDTDGDRLLDGAAIPGKWGEVESVKRSRFEVVPCVGCNWLTALATAKTLTHPHDPNVFGQLATFHNAREFLEAMSEVPSGLTNIAIGAWAGADDVNVYHNLNFDYLTGLQTESPFTFANFGTNLPARAPGVTNAILINSKGQFYVVDVNSPTVEHMLVEWRDIPVVTNHYDAAYNDLWQLRFPCDAGLGAPIWRRITPTNAPNEMPAARWGHAMTYVPGYEIKDQREGKDDRFGEGTHALLDNRKLVVIGGGDGVTKFGDVWEFWIKSNAWTRSQQILNNAAWNSFFAPEIAGGLSDLSAVLLMGYSNTKPGTCPCDESSASWECEGIRFGEPKNRPWDRGYQDSSYDLTYILGGWNNENQYALNEPMDTIYYKSTDDLNDIVEESRAYNNNLRSFDVWQSAESRIINSYENTIGGSVFLGSITNHNRTRVYADLSVRLLNRIELEDGGPTNGVPLGKFPAAPTVTTNGTLAGFDVEIVHATNMATAIRIEEFPFRFTCDRVTLAELIFNVDVGPTNDLDLFIVAEYHRQANPESRPYEWDEEEQNAPNGTPLSRAAGESFVTSLSVPFTITNGFTGELAVNVTPLLTEVYAESDWEGRAIGFVITNDLAENEWAIMNENSAFLRVTHNPRYRVPAQWHAGTRFQTVQGEVPSQRKSFAMAYNYINDRIVVFGGINGNEVLGDTYEGEPIFGEEDEELPLGSTPTDNADVRKVRLVRWQKIPTDLAPAPRWGHSVCYDDVNNRVLIFGGFDKDNRPLNDLWAYTAATVITNVVTDTNGVTTITRTAANGAWQQITDFQDSQRPSPRAGAAMAFVGGQFYRDDNGRYRITKRDKVVLFGGTDGVNYLNDTWYYDEAEVNYDIVTTNGSRWVLADPGGEQSVGPEPRAFAQMAFAQNAAAIPSPFVPESGAAGTFSIVDGDSIKREVGTVLLFGGRRGALPKGSDTDRDLVTDGQEHELGGTAAGRDPRVNALYRTQTTNAVLETVPYTYRRLGTWGGYLPGFTRPALADLEALSYQERLFGWRMGNQYPHAYAGTFLTWQGYPLETSFTNITYEIGNETQWPVEDPDTNRLIYMTGVAGYTADWTNHWFHRPGAGNPETSQDEWELGVPDNSLIGSNGAPPYAYSGRWVYGTDLRGNYPANAVMELISPIFSLQNPPNTNTTTRVDNDNDFFLMFHEWLDLADSNDLVRVDVIRPSTPADIATRLTGLNRPAITLIPNRNNAANTKGKWRRVIAPLNVLGNDTNLFLRFTLQSDTNILTAGGWYVDDIAILQGGEISGMLLAGTNTEVCLLGENFNDHVQDCTLSETNGQFQFGFLPLGNYQLVSPLGTNGPIILAGSGVSTNISAGWLPPVFTGISINSPLVIRWAATNGAAYKLDYTTNLLSGSWTHLYSVTSGVNSTLSYTDPVSTVHRIYRVSITNAP